MSKTATHTDTSYTHYQRGLRVIDEVSDKHWPLWLMAVWDGPYGTVSINTFRQAGKPSEGTNMDFTLAGVTHTRRWEYCFGKLTLARLAREFAEECWNNHLIRTHCEVLAPPSPS